MAEKFINNCKDAHRYFWNFLRHVFREHRPEVIVIILLAILTLIYFAIRAPAAGTPPNWTWAQQFGDTGEEKSQAVVTDATGSSYVTGYFEGEIIIGTTTLTSNGGTDIFVAKYLPDGSVDPVFTPFSVGGDDGNDYGNGIAFDSTNNMIYVAGNIDTGINQDAADFDPGVGVSNPTGSAGLDAFVAKYDALTGAFLAATNTETPDHDQGNAVAVNSDGDVFLVGSYENGTSDIVVNKYDPSLSLVWTRTVNTTGEDEGLGIAVKGSDVYISGYFSGTATFDTETISSRGIGDAFVAKYDTDGVFQWVKKMGGENFNFTDKARGIGLDLSGNPYVTGVFAGDATNTGDVAPIYTAVVAGGLHSLALRDDGTVWSWGHNGSGQPQGGGALGNGTYNNSNIPVQVHGPEDVGFLTYITALAAGGPHSIALKNDGTVWNWGDNGSFSSQYPDYALGNGTAGGSNLPVQVSNLSGVIAIASGQDFLLALEANDSSFNCPYNGVDSICDGQVWAWGYNNIGQYGNGTNDISSIPVLVNSLTDIISIAAGASHSVALKADGTVWAWGFGNFGSLGNGTNTNSNVPVQVSGLTDITSIGAGFYHSFALQADGTVWAWGYNNYGQLGNGITGGISNIPIQISSLSGVANITGGLYYSLALKNDGTVWAWGYNGNGALGDGTTTNSDVPVQVHGTGDVGFLTDIAAIEGGGNHSISLKNDGTVWDWGSNNTGQLGNGNNTNSNVPVPVYSALNPDNLNIIADSDSDVFVAKLNPIDGSISNGGWITGIKMGRDTVELPSLALDENDNIYIAGDFRGSAVDFLGTPLDSGNGGNNSGIFIVKLDSGGNLDWVKQAGADIDTGSFRPATNFNVGSGPFSVATGDFNDDGFSDMAVVNKNSNNVSILLGDGLGAFGSAENYAVGNNPQFIAIDDFNADNFPDLAVANGMNNNVSILLGVGDGTFDSATNFPAGSFPQSIAIYDLNADDILDLAVANSGSNNVSILLGDGLGAFGPATNFVAGSNPFSVAINDFNDDSVPDLAVANSGSNNVSILLGVGDGTFGLATNFAVGSSPLFVATEYLNNDSFPDLAVANGNDNNVSILLGDGLGAFGSAANFAVGSSPQSVAINYFNDDGFPDLAVANSSSNNVSILLGVGDGTFGPATNFTVGLSPQFVSTDDFNSDGKPDLAVANSGINNVSVLLGIMPGRVFSHGIAVVAEDDVRIAGYFENNINFDAFSPNSISEIVDAFIAKLSFGIIPDLTPPTVMSTIPASTATGVAVNSAITATFSEAMNPSTINTGTFTLSNGVTGVVTYNSPTTTFTPSANLAYNTTYTATITTGAEDEAGNSMEPNYTWTFTTVAGGFVTTTTTETFPEEVTPAPAEEPVAPPTPTTVEPMPVSPTTVTVTTPAPIAPKPSSPASLTNITQPEEILPLEGYVAEGGIPSAIQPSAPTEGIADGSVPTGIPVSPTEGIVRSLVSTLTGKIAGFMVSILPQPLLNFFGKLREPLNNPVQGITSIVLISSAIIFFILFRMRKKKGIVFLGGKPLPRAVVEIYSADTPDIPVKRVITDTKGQYYCSIDKGKYIAMIKAKNYLGVYETIYTSEVINVPKKIFNTEFRIEQGE